MNHDRTGVFAGIQSQYSVVRYHCLAATRVGDELMVPAAGTGGGITVRFDVRDELAESRWKAERLLRVFD